MQHFHFMAQIYIQYSIYKEATTLFAYHEHSLCSKLIKLALWCSPDQRDMTNYFVQMEVPPSAYNKNLKYHIYSHANNQRFKASNN